MSSEIAITNEHGSDDTSRFDASLAAELAAERSLVRAIAKTILICIPIGIVFFIGLLAIAVGGDLAWWAIIGLGTLIGLIAAALFGVLAGVVLNAEKLDEVDHDVDRGAA
jgi:Mg/Co/Ni transporter MgtE